jgi:hypothetical protein
MTTEVTPTASSVDALPNGSWAGTDEVVGEQFALARSVVRGQATAPWRR